MRRRAVLTGGVVAALAAFIPTVSAKANQIDGYAPFFQNCDIVLLGLTPVKKQVRLTLCDQWGNTYSVWTNQWYASAMNMGTFSGPYFHEYLHDDPLSQSPWMSHPERIQDKPLTALAALAAKRNKAVDGVFAHLPTPSGDGVFIMSSPLYDQY